MHHCIIVHVPSQVLSESVSTAMTLIGGQEMQGTAKFAFMFDKFFDMLNVSNFTNGTRYRKRFLQPYRSGDDFQLTVSLIFIHVYQHFC